MKEMPPSIRFRYILAAASIDKEEDGPKTQAAKEAIAVQRWHERTDTHSGPLTSEDAKAQLVDALIEEHQTEPNMAKLVAQTTIENVDKAIDRELKIRQSDIRRNTWQR